VVVNEESPVEAFTDGVTASHALMAAPKAPRTYFRAFDSLGRASNRLWYGEVEGHMIIHAILGEECHPLAESVHPRDRAPETKGSEFTNAV
jgi:hypothetical protein